MDRFEFGPLTLDIHVLRRYKNRIQYGVLVFLGDEEPFMTQFPFDKGFPPKFIARKVLRDLKKIVDEPDKPWQRIEMERHRGAPEELQRGLRQMWSWASERPDAIRTAAEAEGIR